MYKVLGTDNQEYGPVSMETVLQWIAEGRADASTQVRRADSADWKTLAEFPEFAAAISSPAPPPPPPPPGAPPYVTPETLISHSIARDSRIDPFYCISRGWNLVKNNFWLTVGAYFLTLVITAPLSAIHIIGPLVGGILSVLMAGGLYVLFLKLVRGQPAELGDIFDGFRHSSAQLLLGALVQGLLCTVGFFLCILPGIYLAVAYCLTPALIIDKRLEFWPALETGRQVITKQWWPFFGLCLLSLLVVFLGVLACLVGFFVAAPVILAALAYAYEDVFGAGAAAQTQPV